MAVGNEMNELAGLMIGQKGGNSTPPVDNTPPAATPPNSDPAPSATPPADAPPVTTPPANTTPPNTDTPPPAVPSIDFSEFGVKDIAELRARVARAQELESENQTLSEYKTGPKFQSERHKLIYDIGSQAEGRELEAVRQFIELNTLDLSSLSDQEKRFEMFKRQPQLSVLSQGEIMELFRDEEISKYGDPSNPDAITSIQKINAKMATQVAEKYINDEQAKWKNARAAEPTPQQSAEEIETFNRTVSESLASFESLPMIKLSGKNENNEDVSSDFTFKVDKNQVQTLIKAIQNPMEYYGAKFKQLGIMTADGKTDNVKMAEFVARIEHFDALINEAYQQGRASQLADKLKSAKQLDNPNPGGAPPTDKPVPKKEKDEMAEGFLKMTGLI